MTTTDDAPTVVDIRRPTPNPLVASAARLTKTNFNRFGTVKGKNTADQQRSADAREMYRIVGEQGFLTTTLAGRCGAARLYVGRIDPDNPTAEPERVEDNEPVTSVLDAFGTTPAARAQLLTRGAANLNVVGDGWFVGVPNSMIPGGSVPDDTSLPASPLDPMGEDETIDLTDLRWFMLSTKEVDTSETNIVKIRLDGDGGEPKEWNPDRLLMIRFWRPDPFEWWLPDSPVLRNLPVLRELVGLTMHVSAQIDSRLAGAGILWIAENVRQAVLRDAGTQAEGTDDDPLMDAIIDMMVTPISDRSNASAVVPGIIGIPLAEGQAIQDVVMHMKFGGPLDAEARQLREEAIRRLALGADCPPELLLGMATMNHWGAWLVREDVVVTHVEPPLALMCDALTREYLWPVLIAGGMDDDEAHTYVVWYSVQHLISRPDRLADAKVLHEAGVVNDGVLRDAAGYDDDDAPEIQDPAITIAVGMVQTAPSLAGDPGLPVLVQQIREMLAGKVPGAAPAGGETTAAPDGEPGDTGTPATDVTTEPDDGTLAASGVWRDTWKIDTEDEDTAVLVSRVPL